MQLSRPPLSLGIIMFVGEKGLGAYTATQLSRPPLPRVRTISQKQISRTFPELFQDSDWFFKGSKIHINPYTPKIVMLILLTALHTFHIFSWDFQNFPGPVVFFQDFSVLENAIVNFRLSGFPGPVRTLLPPWNMLVEKKRGYAAIQCKLRICIAT